MKRKIIPLILTAAVALILVVLLASGRQPASPRENDILAQSANPVLAKAISAYYDRSGDAVSDSIKATWQSFGCHAEVYVYKDGRLVMTFNYFNGQLYEK